MGLGPSDAPEELAHLGLGWGIVVEVPMFGVLAVAENKSWASTYKRALREDGGTGRRGALGDRVGLS